MTFRSSILPTATIVLLALAPAACEKKEAAAPAPAPAAAAPAPAKADPVCKEGSKSQYPDGKLKECALAQDWAAGPATCRMNWTLVLHRTAA
jgi:hypothetical protein